MWASLRVLATGDLGRGPTTDYRHGGLLAWWPAHELHYRRGGLLTNYTGNSAAVVEVPVGRMIL